MNKKGFTSLVCTRVNRQLCLNNIEGSSFFLVENMMLLCYKAKPVSAY